MFSIPSFGMSFDNVLGGGGVIFISHSTTTAPDVSGGIRGVNSNDPEAGDDGVWSICPFIDFLQVSVRNCFAIAVVVGFVVKRFETLSKKE